MKVILTDDVVGLGDIGETVTVKPGYARNFLIPRGLAFESETASARQVAHKMRQVESKKRRNMSKAQEFANVVRNTSIELGLRVGSGGKVFGSINARDIADALVAQGQDIDRRRLMLDEPIRKIGTHFVKVKLHPQVETQLKVIVNSVSATKEEEEQEAERLRVALEQKAAARKTEEEEESEAE